MIRKILSFSSWLSWRSNALKALRFAGASWRFQVVISRKAQEKQSAYSADVTPGLFPRRVTSSLSVKKLPSKELVCLSRTSIQTKPAQSVAVVQTGTLEAINFFSIAKLDLYK